MWRCARQLSRLVVRHPGADARQRRAAQGGRIIPLPVARVRMSDGRRLPRAMLLLLAGSAACLGESATDRRAPGRGRAEVVLYEARGVRPPFGIGRRRITASRIRLQRPALSGDGLVVVDARYEERSASARCSRRRSPRRGPRVGDRGGLRQPDTLSAGPTSAHCVADGTLLSAPNLPAQATWLAAARERFGVLPLASTRVGLPLKRRPARRRRSSRFAE